MVGRRSLPLCASQLNRFACPQVAEKLDSLVKLQREKAQQSPLRRHEQRRGLFGMF